MIERRAFHRISVNRIIFLKLPDGSTDKAKLINLSENGLAILYGCPMQSGSAVSLNFSVSYRNISYDVSIHGVVRHSHFKGTSYCIGFEFQDVDAKSLKSIRAFIHHKLSRLTV